MSDREQNDIISRRGFIHALGQYLPLIGVGLGMAPDIVAARAYGINGKTLSSIEQSARNHRLNIIKLPRPDWPETYPEYDTIARYDTKYLQSGYSVARPNIYICYGNLYMSGAIENLKNVHIFARSIHLIDDGRFNTSRAFEGCHNILLEAAPANHQDPINSSQLQVKIYGKNYNRSTGLQVNKAPYYRNSGSANHYQYD